MALKIENFQINKTGYFFRLEKPLTKKDIEIIFNEVSEKKQGRFLIKKVKEKLSEEACYSVCCFKFISEPSFLENTDILEEKHAFLLLLETNGKIAIFKKLISSIPNLLEEKLEQYKLDDFYSLYSHKIPIYEKISMRNNSLSNFDIKQRTLEANNLNSMLSSSTTSRSIPTRAKMRFGTSNISINPHNSMVSILGNSSNIYELYIWVNHVFEELDIENKIPTILNSFSYPTSLEKIIEMGHKITGVLIELSSLEKDYTSGNIEISSKSIPLDDLQINRLFKFLRKTILIENNCFAKKRKILSLKIHKKKISIDSRVMRNILITEQSGKELTLEKYINDNHLISACFEQPQYLYHAKNCFENRKITENCSRILSILDDSVDFSNLRSEKEKNIHTNSTDIFPNTSLFSRIEDNYKSYDLLICDDMNDEWADHIAINNNEVLFIHSKFAKSSGCSASDLHEVISQALKNIGMMTASKEEFLTKYDKKWNLYYEKTKIPRIKTQVENDLERYKKYFSDIPAEIKSDPELLKKAIERKYFSDILDKINSNPNILKKVIIAVPFLSKKELEKELGKQDISNTYKPHITQLIWLINSFISTCIENNTQPYILCGK